MILKTTLRYVEHYILAILVLRLVLAAIRYSRSHSIDFGIFLVYTLLAVALVLPVAVVHARLDIAKQRKKEKQQDRNK